MPYNAYVTMLFGRCQPQEAQTSFFPALRLSLVGGQQGCKSRPRPDSMPELNPHIQDTVPSGPENTLRIGRLPSPVRESEFKSFISNLKEFLTERPVKVRSSSSDVFKQPGFGESLNDNFKEFFRPAPKGPVNSDLLVNWNAGRGGSGNLVEEYSIHARAGHVGRGARAGSGPDSGAVAPAIAESADDQGERKSGSDADFAVPAENAGRGEKGGWWRWWRRARCAAGKRRQAGEVLNDAIYAPEGESEY